MKSIHLRIALPLIFFIFIGSIIYIADSANYNFAFRFVGFIPYGDKIMHGLLYGIMALLLNYGLDFKSVKFLRYSLQVGALIVLTFAGIEEITQYWIPSRTCDIWDFVADIIGVLGFCVLGRSMIKIPYRF